METKDTDSWYSKVFLFSGSAALAVATLFLRRKTRSSRSGMLSARSLNFLKCPHTIKDDLAKLKREYERQVQGILNSGTDIDFQKTFKRLSDADGNASLASAALTLPALVSGDPKVRQASTTAKKELKHMWSQTYARPDLYKCLQHHASGASNDEELRLVEITLSKFRQLGAGIESANDRKTFVDLDNKCASLSFQIEQNINEDTMMVPISEAELRNCGNEFIASLPQHDSDPSARLCSVKAPVYVPIMRRASAAARRKMLAASRRRCATENGPLLDELLSLRHRAARYLGYDCHADRMLACKMAGSTQTAKKFVEEMLQRVSGLRASEMQQLQARKNAYNETNGVKQEQVHAWDVAFLSDMLKREQLHLDDEKVKEFFPLRETIKRILSVYSSFLGLHFQDITASANAWHEEVVVYEVRRQSDNEVAGHLYLDQFPRSGKFGHQMIVPLAPSFVDSRQGRRCVPACVNISNLPRPQGDKPALLRWNEMKTLFHELGHAMHCLCTTTSHSVMSWAWPMVPWPGGVEQDFLEVPSMALEKFASDPSLLSKVAYHFTTKAVAPSPPPLLDADTIVKIRALERWMVGIGQTRYFSMALFDLIAHSSAPPYSFNGQDGLSAQQLYRCVYEHYNHLDMDEEAHPCASWYHLVIGYDAGYYGYGWSDVYAADVYEAMASNKEGPVSAANGHRLRDEILGPCATRPGMDMLKNFLGREPNTDAWCKRNGVPV